jgi:imidazolonepropionase-like amidohydrolase
LNERNDYGKQIKLVGGGKLMIILKNARIITDGKVLEKGSVVIEDERIKEILSSEETLTDGEIFDLTGKTVLPGLVNSHIHFELRRVFGSVESNARLSMETLALRAARTALCCLRDGVTSARDMGHGAVLQFALREAIDMGAVAGPRISCSGGAIAMSYGHNSLTKHNVISLEEALSEIRRQANEGADFIKITASHDDLKFVHPRKPCVPWFSAQNLKEMALFAQSTGMKITAHANGEEAIRRVVDAGFDCVEHAIFLNGDLARQMADKGMFYCPTMTGYKQNADEFWKRPQDWLGRYRDLWATHRDTVQNAIEAGVKIVMGTDTLGDLIEEMELLQEAGMDTMSIIKGATSLGAKLLRFNDTGSIARGKLADLIVVEGNPIESLSVLRRVNMVFKGGKFYDPKVLRSVIPESKAFVDDPNAILTHPDNTQD